MEGIIGERLRERVRVIEEARKWSRGLKYPVTAILVGSYARGDFNKWSDVDIILVSPAFEGKTPIERLYEVDAPPGYEVIPWTPRELERMMAKGNPLAIEASRHGVILRDDLGLAKLVRGSGSHRLL